MKGDKLATTEPVEPYTVEPFNLPSEAAERLSGLAVALSKDKVSVEKARELRKIITSAADIQRPGDDYWGLEF